MRKVDNLLSHPESAGSFRKLNRVINVLRRVPSAAERAPTRCSWEPYGLGNTLKEMTKKCT